jgi:hypothetical protein
MEHKFDYIKDVHELYQEIGGLVHFLLSHQEQEWAAALESAMRVSATSGLEITGAIRTVLRSLEAQGGDERLGIRNRVDRCLRYIDYIWDDPHRED